MLGHAYTEPVVLSDSPRGVSVSFTDWGGVKLTQDSFGTVHSVILTPAEFAALQQLAPRMGD